MAVLIQSDTRPSQGRGASEYCGRGAHTPTAGHGLGWRIAAILFFLIAAAQLAQAQAEPTEYEIKAAFVYNFAKFVEWPPDAFANSSDPVRLCVLGNHALSSDLQRIIAGKMIGSRSLQVHRVGLFQIRECQVLFVGLSESGRLQQVLEAARGASVLTVGETPGFLEQGGVINFVFDQNRIRFEVNLKAAQEARLKLSSKLLNLAKSVEM
jgi:YfiR/HmsC-like